ncbi:MAG: DUF2062 domain-containing protein [Deltaproteobacteria bacterium]|nr:DUF2062 domain-containing protein [Deltaproteobacteria bacterium]
MPTAEKESDKGAKDDSSARPRVPGDERRNWWRRALSKYFVEPLIQSRNPPWFDARAAAVGMVVGFGVPAGAQMIALGALRAIIRFNVVLAFVFTWVSNPFTIIPMYYGYYRLGSLILGYESILSSDAFQQAMKPLLSAGYFWESLPAFLALGEDILIRWSVAAVLVSVITAIPGYLLTYRFQKLRCLKEAEELGVTYEALIKDLEERSRMNEAMSGRMPESGP